MSDSLEKKTTGGQSDTSFGLNILGGSAVPDLNSILAFKVLAEKTTPDKKTLYDRLLHEEKKYLESALELLAKDSVLRMKLGGYNIKTAMALSQILRKKAEEMNFETHIDGTVSDIINAETGTFETDVSGKKFDGNLVGMTIGKWGFSS